MNGMGIRPVIRGTPHQTTEPSTKAPRPLGKVNRQCWVPDPDLPWVSDFTYVSTQRGLVSVAFGIDDYSLRIVGWRVSILAQAGWVLDALEQAVHDRRLGKGMVLDH
jgi:putative transposase